MKKTCSCCYCGKTFGTDNEDACKIGVWQFCSTECLKEWVVDRAEGLDDDDFDYSEDEDGD